MEREKLTNLGLFGFYFNFGNYFFVIKNKENKEKRRHVFF